MSVQGDRPPNPQKKVILNCSLLSAQFFIIPCMPCAGCRQWISGEWLVWHRCDVAPLPAGLDVTFFGELCHVFMCQQCQTQNPRDGPMGENILWLDARNMTDRGESESVLGCACIACGRKRGPLAAGATVNAKGCRGACVGWALYDIVSDKMRSSSC